MIVCWGYAVMRGWQGFHMFKKFIGGYASDEGGVFAVITAFMFLTIMGFVALGVDVSQWMMQKRSLQTAADAGALAGAYELVNGLSDTDAKAAALKEAEKNGYNPAGASASITTTIDPNGNGTGIATVKVALTEAAQGWFSKLLGGSTPNTGVEATAAEQVAGSSQYCMLALGTGAGVITTSGSVDLDATTCGLAANGGMTINGNPTIDVGSINLGGSLSGGGKNFSYTSLKDDTGKTTTNPYAGFTPPDPPYTCGKAEVSGPHTGTTSDGDAATVYCGGFSPSGTLPSGIIYVVNGDFGDNGGTITTTSDGATVVLTNSNGGTTGNATFHGNGTLNLTAPTTGSTAGIAIFQDPDAPTGCDDQITGTPTINISGVVYAPTCEWEMGGNTGSDATGLCTEIIANTIDFHGNPSIGTNCASSGALGIGITYTVQLIE